MKYHFYSYSHIYRNNDRLSFHSGATEESLSEVVDRFSRYEDAKYTILIWKEISKEEFELIKKVL